jgi:hypothetical protein
MSHSMKTTKSRKKATTRTGTNRWSKRVTETSDALDLKAAVFKLPSARAIAASLKRSAERSRRRKSTPYRSAISMLTFYINRAGSNISATQRRKLERAKDELRTLFRKPAAPGRLHT